MRDSHLLYSVNRSHEKLLWDRNLWNLCWVWKREFTLWCQHELMSFVLWCEISFSHYVFNKNQWDLLYVTLWTDPFMVFWWSSTNSLWYFAEFSWFLHLLLYIWISANLNIWEMKGRLQVFLSFKMTTLKWIIRYMLRVWSSC